MTTILFVEDDPDIVLVTSELLESEGYFVIQASNGKEGLDLALISNPDVVLTDLMMPVMDGLAMILKLRASGFARPAVLYTSMHEDRIPEERRVYDAFIAKPALSSTLISVIKGLAPAPSLAPTRESQSEHRPIASKDGETIE